MKNKILGIACCGLLVLTFAFALDVNAVNTNAGATTSENENSETNGNSDKVALAREKRLIIRTQSQELAQLREQLKLQVAEQKTLMLQYREQEELTAEQRLEIKAMIQTMEQLRIKLGTVYHNAVKAMKSYKSDSSTDKITGLDLVIASQQERIKLLEEACNILE